MIEDRRPTNLMDDEPEEDNIATSKEQTRGHTKNKESVLSFGGDKVKSPESKDTFCSI